MVALAIKTFLDEVRHLETFIVASGDAALAVIPDQAPDLILMDMHIQGSMSGIEVAQEAKGSILTSIGDGIIVAGSTGIVEYMNN